MGNTFPKRFIFNPNEYRKYEEGVNGSSIEDFLYYKFKSTIDASPHHSYDVIFDFIFDAILVLDENQYETLSIVFEIFEDPFTKVLKARIVKFPA
jgi:hypothetical protein